MYLFRPKAVQLDLFRSSKGCQPLDTPEWQSLPPPTRRRATVLMTRLFLEHRRTEADADRDPENGDV